MFELILTLMNSTQNYVINRTHNPNNSDSYLYEMSSIIHSLNNIINNPFLDYDDKYQQLYENLLLRKLSSCEKRDSWFSSKEKYRKLAQEHALDIVRSIKARFDP